MFAFTSRINLRAANKRCIENLALAGGLDCFSAVNRAQFFFKQHEKDASFLEKAIRFGLQYQNEIGSAQQSLFGGDSEVDLPKPTLPVCESWSNVYALNQEKEMVGVYISGHPLDDYKLEIDNFCNASFDKFNLYMDQFKGKELSFAGVVSEASERMSKKGNHYGILTVEDYKDAGKFFLFGDSYLKFRRFLVEGAFLYIKGKVEPKRFNKHEFEFKIHHIELLNEVRDKLVKSITLHINSNFINNDFIDELSSLCVSNKGNCGLNIVLLNEKERIVLDLKSSAYKVELSNPVSYTHLTLPTKRIV